MNTFSERMGIVKPPEVMQLDGMTEGLSNLLANFSIDIFKIWPVRPRHITMSRHEIDNNKKNANIVNNIRDKISNGLKKHYVSFDFISNGVFYPSSFIRHFEELEWCEKYDLVETVVCCLKGIDNNKFYYEKEKLNMILERENSGYRMDENGQFIKITNEQERKEIQQAETCGEEKVENHISNAISRFSDRENPDYPNTVKECMNALEVLAQIHTGKTKTLSSLAQSLPLPEPLKEAIKTLYKYSSNEGGVRHGNKDSKHTVTFDEAKFILVTTSALINFIISQSAKNSEPEK